MIIQTTYGLNMVVELFGKRLTEVEAHLQHVPDKKDLLDQQKFLKEHVEQAKLELTRDQVK